MPARLLRYSATEPTEVRVIYDARRIIIGVICFDSEPGRIRRNQMQRDQSLGADDRFMMAIDTFADGRSGYYFEINPSGAMGDGLVLAGAGSGINFQRTIRRKIEETLWTGWARNQGLTFMPAAGRLQGLDGLHQGLGLDLLPYLVGNSSAAPGRGARASVETGAIGGDIAYNVTPSLRANVSINTDFAETEVDQRRVNLTRFPLFFAEKRSFFLEGASLFVFSRETGNAITPFFSRRIGLDESGVPQPIDYGAKLTGHAGAFDLGALHVRTRDRGGVAGEDFTVLRSQRRFWRQSYVGALVTNRSDVSEPSRQTARVDFALATSTLFGKELLEVSGFHLNTTKRAGSRGGAAFGARINMPNDPINWRLFVREVQDGYDPAVGFVDRRAYREIAPGLRYTVHTERSRYGRYPDP